MAVNMTHSTSSVPPTSETAAGLVRRLVDDLSILLRKELALARVEVTQALDDAKKGLAGVAVGGAVLYAGFLALLAAVILMLSRVMPAWGAALLVGAITLIAGYAMIKAAQKKLAPSNLKPERTQEALRRDKEEFQRRTA
jgi:hypothetical protein